MPKFKIAIFASGSGTNAEKILEYFQHNTNTEVSLILSNKENAGVIERAKRWQVPVRIFNRNTFYNTNEIVDLLQQEQISLVILAGFLWLIPENLVQAFPQKMINIHPALLPGYGGKGMYGNKVHQAVHAANEAETGITIHYVNERYDEGAIIFQASCQLTPEDTPESIAHKVQKLEHEYFPKVIGDLVQKSMKN